MDASVHFPRASREGRNVGAETLLAIRYSPLATRYSPLAIRYRNFIGT